MAAHTPGPWFFVTSSDKREFGFIRESRNAVDPSFPATMAGRHVAVARVTTTGRTGEEAHANGRLMAAAPDLLDALKRAHACATVDNDGNCLGCFVSEAIAKAEGN
jgi:hypothetical protein